jgi:phosphohistidine phosphatase
MKTLYLVRHAKSSWDDKSLDDFDRPLNKRGKKDAPFMGRKLRKLWDAEPELIISSPAKRARKTAKIMAEEIRYPKKKIQWEDALYEATETTLLKVIHEQHDDIKSLMILGHNPSLTAFYNLMSDEVIDNIPTSGVVCVEFPAENWAAITPNSGKLVFFDYPKRYAEAIEQIENEIVDVEVTDIEPESIKKEVVDDVE